MYCIFLLREVGGLFLSRTFCSCLFQIFTFFLPNRLLQNSHTLRLYSNVLGSKLGRTTNCHVGHLSSQDTNVIRILQIYLRWNIRTDEQAWLTYFVYSVFCSGSTFLGEPRAPRVVDVSKRCFRHLAGLFGREVSQSHDLYLHITAQHTKTRTNIHALSGIRTHDPSLQAAKSQALDRTTTVIGFCVICCLK
jgi:hypothetical protein